MDVIITKNDDKSRGDKKDSHLGSRIESCQKRRGTTWSSDDSMEQAEW